jgi:hypothetical protein
MSQNDPARSYTLAEDEKATPAMVYTPTSLAWGDIISKELVRVKTWLRTNMAPIYLSLYDARVLQIGGAGSARPWAFSEYHVPTSHAIAFHLLPPAPDLLESEPLEANRKLEPVTVLAGLFRFDGFVQMASVSNLKNYLDATKEIFTPLHDVEISHPATPSLGAMHIPYVLVRQETAMFAPRPV